MEDWLEIESTGRSVVAATAAGLPAEVELPVEYRARLDLIEQCWAELRPIQKTFLSAFRECRFNAAAAARLCGHARHTHITSMHEKPYATIVRIWRAHAAANAIDRDRLLARQDDIVETLLTPKPVLHQGIPVYHDGKVLQEVEAGGASRANETLMKAAGMLKDKEVDINVGVIVGPPTFNIQVMPTPPGKIVQRESVVIDAKFTETPSDVEGWLDA
jgi:hypothetical protein